MILSLEFDYISILRFKKNLFSAKHFTLQSLTKVIINHITFKIIAKYIGTTTILVFNFILTGWSINNFGFGGFELDPFPSVFTWEKVIGNFHLGIFSKVQLNWWIRPS